MRSNHWGNRVESTGTSEYSCYYLAASYESMIISKLKVLKKFFFFSLIGRKRQKLTRPGAGFCIFLAVEQRQ